VLLSGCCRNDPKVVLRYGFIQRLIIKLRKRILFTLEGLNLATRGVVILQSLCFALMFPHFHHHVTILRYKLIDPNLPFIVDCSVIFLVWDGGSEDNDARRKAFVLVEFFFFSFSFFSFLMVPLPSRFQVIQLQHLNLLEVFSMIRVLDFCCFATQMRILFFFFL
jgi:hypothetical protein